MMWFLIITIIVVICYLKLENVYNYWKKRGVPCIKPTLLLGNMSRSILRKISLSEAVQELYNYYPGVRYIGIYQFVRPILMIKDLELIKQITVKEFNSFSEHAKIVADNVDPLWSKNLFAARTEKWRELRPTLSPVFTSSKMKFMFNLMVECAEHFVHHFSKIEEDIIEIELKDVFTRFTNDAIATTAFGLKCDSFEQPNNEFYLKSKEAMTFKGLRLLNFILYSLSPWLVEKLKIRMFTEEISNFFRNIISETIRARESRGIIRPDMIHLLLRSRKGVVDEERTETSETGFATAQETTHSISRRHYVELSDEDITAQALVFFLGGFDTTSVLMCYIMYELAINPDIQERLRREVDDTFEKCEGKLSYEALAKMSYLDMVVSETLRKWPPAAFIDRICTKPFVIAKSNPGEVDILVKKGSSVWIPCYPIHRDPKYYPNPDKFDPERFNEDNKDKIHPYTFLPFGLVPRNCIGSRFALMENKIVTYYLLRTFQLVPTEKTPIPIILDPAYFNLTPKGGFRMGLKKRQC